MHTLVIRHIESLEPARFVVQRAADSKTGEPVEVHSPVGWPVEGQPGGLLPELRWYLEDFLDYPFDPWTERATRVEAAVHAWGRAAFEALFGGGRARDFYRDAVRDGPEKLLVQVRSDDPRVLAWPWEALEDGEAAPLALTGRLERSLDKVADPTPLSADLPRNRVNILLVIARPFDGDVGYRSIARPLVELVEKRNLPAHVTVLRPPTFAHLQVVLTEHPNTFHLLHFDGHGGYGDTAGPAGVDGHRLQAVQGRLVFETDDGSPDPVDAGRLADLLRVHRLPTVVLNACQSAMLDERAEDPFASVAAALLKGGVRSVVAMAWSLYVSGAQQFLPAFYETLFKTGDVGTAALAGRRKMREQPGRVCARGKFPLADWLVPVVYQQVAFDFSFAATVPSRRKRRVAPTKQMERVALPDEARDEENPYGFVGRDRALLALERAMRRKPAGILIHGLGGIGKTTLARCFLHWLAQTGGLGGGAFWFTFNDIRSVEHVVNRMTGALFGADAQTKPMEAKVDALARALRERPVVVVWDNFESARGIEGTPERGLLPPEDLTWLRQLLAKMRGGRTKILISSRGDEAWLGAENRFKLDLGGLHGEERWAFCQTILGDLGRKADQNDPELVALMDTLDGHPLMMRMVLPWLEAMSAAQVLAAVRGNLAALGLPGDALANKVTATLQFVEQGLPEGLRPLCMPLGLHERFVAVQDLAAMAAAVDGNWKAEHIEQFLQALAVAGLVTPRGHGLYALHPALTGFLRTRKAEDATHPWERAFVDRMGRIADAATPLPPHEQRHAFLVHYANFHHALQVANTHHVSVMALALIQCIAAYARSTRDFTEAERRFAELAERAREDNPELEAVAYYQLGAVAFERRDFDAAKQWCEKSLSISDGLGDEHGLASNYDLFGSIEEQRRDFDAAEKWYLKLLAIAEKHDDRYGIASAYHKLGSISEERGNFDTAEKWCLRSLTIKEDQRDEHGAAVTHHQLGVIAKKRGDLNAAEQWYLKSLAISEKRGNEHVAASSYHELGVIAEERGDFDAADKWYLKFLEVEDKHDNKHNTAVAYHALGVSAHKRRDFDLAEKWYLKSLIISEGRGDRHISAFTYQQLGKLALGREQYEISAQWLIKCVQEFIHTHDSAQVDDNAHSFFLTESAAPIELRPRLRAMWHDACLPPLQEPAEN